VVVSLRLRAIIRAIRPHQWAKNLLVFLPLIASHRILEPALLRGSALCFAAFCLAASAVYAVNDCLDVDADRRHPEKRSRPFASGALPLAWAWPMAAILVFGASLIAWKVSPSTLAALGAYVVLGMAYSFRLKEVVLVDVIVLSSLYAARVMGGYEATGVAYSAWLMSFSLFAFFSLALMKRYIEIRTVAATAERSVLRRGYLAEDAGLVLALGISTGMVSALVLTLYFESRNVLLLYRRPLVLWLLCPLWIYYLSRMWLLACRGQMEADPVLAALRDPTTHVVAGAAAVVLWFAAGEF
jgi:4-hydroxybenzoate polyprenyltransferase